VVLVEHDMRLVMNVSDRIHVLAHGRTLAEGSAAEVRSNPAVVEAYLGIHGSQEAAGAVH
jgi:branched-chain amino acid transport system ATP-binding protein